MSALERLRRAELAKLRMDELVDEARRCRDPGRLSAIEDESRVVVQSLRDIRREQLMEDVQRYGEQETAEEKGGPVRSFLRRFKNGL